MSLFFVTISGLCAIALIAFSALVGIALNGFWPDIFSHDFWETLSSLATAGGAIATAFAASVALVVFRHQKQKEAVQQIEADSKYYMEQCYETARQALELFEERNGDSESIIATGLILGEVTQLERLITDKKHQQIYSVKREHLISRLEPTLAAVKSSDLSGLRVKPKKLGVAVPLPLGQEGKDALGKKVKLEKYFSEYLLDCDEFRTPFQGVPLGRLLAVIRYFSNGAHFIRPDDQITDRELGELEHERSYRHIKEYIDACLNLTYHNGEMVLRETPVDIRSIDMNYDLGITRIYFDNVPKL